MACWLLAGPAGRLQQAVAKAPLHDGQAGCSAAVALLTCMVACMMDSASPCDTSNIAAPTCRASSSCRQAVGRVSQRSSQRCRRDCSTWDAAGGQVGLPPPPPTTHTHLHPPSHTSRLLTGRPLQPPPASPYTNVHRHTPTSTGTHLKELMHACTDPLHHTHKHARIHTHR